MNKEKQSRLYYPIIRIRGAQDENYFHPSDIIEKSDLLLSLPVKDTGKRKCFVVLSTLNLIWLDANTVKFLKEIDQNAIALLNAGAKITRGRDEA